MDQSKYSGKSNISYTKLSDGNKEEDKQKTSSGWKNFTSKFSTNTKSFPEREHYKKF